MQTAAAQGSHKSFGSHIIRGLYSGAIVCTLGSQSPRLICSHSLVLGLSLWLVEPEALGKVAQARFPSLGWAMQASWLNLWLTLFEILDLTSLGFTRALISSAHCTHGLGICWPTSSPGASCASWQNAFPQKLGVHPLKRFVSLWPEFLDAIVPFLGLVVCGIVLGLQHICTKAPE